MTAVSQVTAVSPHFVQSSDKPDVIAHRSGREYPWPDKNTGILVYEDRVVGWFFDFGEMLKSEDNAGFAVLQIAVAQIEGMEQYRRGETSKNKSEDFLCKGLRRIFPLEQWDDSWFNQFYTAVRCGLFHDGMTRRGVGISKDFPEALVYDEDRQQVLVNPNSFLDAVRSDFEQYLVDLKDPANSELRESFWKLTKQVAGIQ
jgi:hypothetical protein